MDCQKARYFLVVSFDESPSDADRAELAHHLKDCRACRHESFYYRELFSAEKQVPAHHPRGDFNERLLAEIRLREARSAWPVAETSRRSFRWPLVYVPALFGAAALAGFLAFLPEQPASTPVAVADPMPSVAQPIQASLDRPRYVPAPRNRRATSTLIFEWPSSQAAGPAGDPFRPMLVKGGANLRYMRPRSQEQYVLPVVTQMVERDRIY